MQKCIYLLKLRRRRRRVSKDIVFAYLPTVWYSLSNKDSYKVGEGLYRSLINDVSLLEFTSLCLFSVGQTIGVVKSVENF